MVNCQLCPHQPYGGADRQLNSKICPVAGFLKVGGGMGLVKSGIGEEGKMGRKGFGGGSTKSGVGEP